MTKFIDIKKLIEDKGVDKTELGKVLFPSVKFPKRAIERILSGEGELSSSQIVKLADYLGMKPHELFEPKSFFLDTTNDEGHVFIFGKDFTVKVNKNTWEAEIFYKGESIKKGVFCTADTTIAEFRDTVMSEIDAYLELC